MGGDLRAAVREFSGCGGDCIGGLRADDCVEGVVWDRGFNRNDVGGGNRGLSGEKIDGSEGVNN